MRIGRTLPPAASPISLRDIIAGLMGLLRGEKEKKRFRSEIKKYFGINYVYLLSSGKAALTIILRALHELQPDRDEVLIPAFTCYSVPSAIVRAGLKVKLCDIDPDTLDFNFNDLARILSESYARGPANYPNNLDKFNNQNADENFSQDKRSSRQVALPASAGRSRLLAIVPVHLFGLPANVSYIRNLVHDPGVAIVEDAAQAMGGEWNGEKLGMLGDVGFYSLGRGKAFSTVGGGVILTNRADIAANIEAQLKTIPHWGLSKQITIILKAILLSIFQRPSLFWLPKSLPFLRVGDTFYDPYFKIYRFSPFQAGLAKKWRQKQVDFTNRRRSSSKQWSKIMETKSVYNYISPNGRLPNLIRFPIRIKDHALRETILKKSGQLGLGVELTYPDAVSSIPQLKDNFENQTFLMAQELAQQLVTLPVHPYLSSDDKIKIKKFLLELTS